MNQVVIYSTKINLDGSINYVFKYKMPSTFKGGFELSYSYDNVNYIFGKYRPDIALKSLGRTDKESEYTYRYDGNTMFNYTLVPSDNKPGSKIYFKLKAITSDRSVSNYVSVVEAFTPPDVPSNVKVIQESDFSSISWTEPKYADANKSITRIRLRKYNLTPINFKLDSGILYSDDITIGEYYVVHDHAKISFWHGKATTQGQFDLASTIIKDSSDVYTVDTPVSKYNINLFKLDTENYIELAQFEPTFKSSKLTTYRDQAIAHKHLVAYGLICETPDALVHSETYLPSLNIDLSKVSPMWRSLDKSNTNFIKSLTWRRFKSALVGDVFYDKNYWTLPYTSKQKTSLIGWVGVAYSLVDIFVNGKLFDTVTSNEYGEFEFKYNFIPSDTKIYVQARSQNNVKFSNKSAVITVRAKQIYTHFAAISTVLNTLRSSQTSLRDMYSIDKCSVTDLNDIHARKVGLSLTGDEDPEIFRKFVKYCNILYLYMGYESAYSLYRTMCLALLKDICDVKFLYNSDAEETQSVGVNSIIHTFNDAQQVSEIKRKRYLYGVAAKSLNAYGVEEETSPTWLTIDNRWYPAEEYYKPINIIEWDLVPKALSYTIYKQEIGSLSRDYVTSEVAKVWETKETFVVDLGNLDSHGSGEYAIPYNASEIDSPKNVRSVGHYLLGTYKNLLKKGNHFTILVFMKGDTVLPGYIRDRLIFILNIIVPSHQLFTFVEANDTGVKIFNKKGLQIK